MFGKKRLQPFCLVSQFPSTFREMIHRDVLIFFKGQSRSPRHGDPKDRQEEDGTVVQREQNEERKEEGWLQGLQAEPIPVEQRRPQRSL